MHEQTKPISRPDLDEAAARQLYESGPVRRRLPMISDAIALINQEDPGRAWWLLKQLDGQQREAQASVAANLGGIGFQLDGLIESLNGKRDKQYVEMAWQIKELVNNTMQIVCQFPGRAKIVVEAKVADPRSEESVVSRGDSESGENGQAGLTAPAEDVSDGDE